MLNTQFRKKGGRQGPGQMKRERRSGGIYRPIPQQGQQGDRSKRSGAKRKRTDIVDDVSGIQVHPDMTECPGPVNVHMESRIQIDPNHGCIEQPWSGGNFNIGVSPSDTQKDWEEYCPVSNP